MSKFAGISDADLQALADEKKSAFEALIETENPTVEQVNEAESLAAERDDIAAEQRTRTEAAADAAARFSALRERKFGVEAAEETVEASEQPAEEETPEEPAEEADTEEETPEETTEETEPAGTPASEEGAEVEAAVEEPEPEQTPEPVKARTKTVAELASRVKRPATPKDTAMPLSITAAANVDGFNAGQSLDDIDAISKAALAKMRGFTPPSGDGSSVDLQKFGVAQIRLGFDKDLVIDRGTDDMEVLERAGNEARLEGQSLTAAGGWCAPSETLYDLMADESLDGILSLPEVQVNRGGIRYTEGPQFADFYAQAGFIQTEAQAIAGTTKPCYEVECPDFTEVRLDAVGLCIKVPILTNSAYPELVNRFTSGTMVAHQHMVNANVISRMIALADATRTFTGLGATLTDTLEAIELVIQQRRQKYRLSFNRTLEVVLPVWVKGAVRADLSRRTGQFNPVTDQQINAHFAAIGANVSFVYDWQDLDLVEDEVPVGDNINAYPATFEALVYPAGTFVKGVSDVINLSAVYDAASLATNTYTGLFMEQGILVAKRQYGADRIVLPVCNAGRTGANDLNCA